MLLDQEGRVTRVRRRALSRGYPTVLELPGGRQVLTRRVEPALGLRGEAPLDLDGPAGSVWPDKEEVDLRAACRPVVIG